MKKQVSIIIFSFLILAGLICAYILGFESRPKVYLNNSGAIPSVTISEIMANKEQYHNMPVMVTGYLWIGYEMCEIYEEETNPLLYNQNAICVDFNELIDLRGDTIPDDKLFNTHGDKVVIIGLYDSVRTGHFAVCAGSIKGLSNITFY